MFLRCTNFSTSLPNNEKHYLFPNDFHGVNDEKLLDNKIQIINAYGWVFDGQIIGFIDRENLKKENPWMKKLDWSKEIPPIKHDNKNYKIKKKIKNTHHKDTSKFPPSIIKNYRKYFTKNERMRIAIFQLESEFYDEKFQTDKFKKISKGEVIDGKLKCDHCKEDFNEKEIERNHKIPVKFFGDSSKENLQPLCDTCHDIYSKHQEIIVLYHGEKMLDIDPKNNKEYDMKKYVEKIEKVTIHHFKKL